MDFSAFLLPCLLAVSAHPSIRPAQDSTGIEGVVYKATGNRMPSPDHKPASGGLPGVRSTVCVFELTNIRQVAGTQGSPCFTAVNTRLVRKVDTDKTGRFIVLLPPGHYSVFTRNGALFCSGRRDEKNNIGPVEVLAGKLTRVDCSVETDHEAVY